VERRVVDAKAAPEPDEQRADPGPGDADAEGQSVSEIQARVCGKAARKGGESI